MGDLLGAFFFPVIFSVFTGSIIVILSSAVVEGVRSRLGLPTAPPVALLTAAVAAVPGIWWIWFSVRYMEVILDAHPGPVALIPGALIVAALVAASDGAVDEAPANYRRAFLVSLGTLWGAATVAFALSPTAYRMGAASADILEAVVNEWASLAVVALVVVAVVQLLSTRRDEAP